MKYNKMKKGIKHIKNISLSSHEKEVMFTRLDLYMKENPVKEIVAHPSTWHNFFGQVGQVKGYRSLYSIAALIAVLFTGVGVANASESALPGDALYPIKVKLIEPIKSVFKVGTKAKFEYEQEKVIIRLDEVKALVEKGEFKNDKRGQLEKEFERSVKVLNDNNQKNIELKVITTEKDQEDKNIDFESKINTSFEEIKKANIYENVDVEKFEERFKNELSGKFESNVITDYKNDDNNEDKSINNDSLKINL